MPSVPKSIQFGIAALVIAISPAIAQQRMDPKETEQWEPKPPVVQPAERPGLPPSDAFVLFSGKDLSEWISHRDGGPAHWKVADGVMTVDKASGNIVTRRQFRNYQLHLEWLVPRGITDTGQHRGNSGVFLATTGPDDTGYELQILNSYNNETYVNGQAGAIYKQIPPLVNPARPPGEWQTYDIIWTAPVFANDGSLQSPARITALFNGVLIQNNAALSGETVYVGKPAYRAYASAPIMLQAHQDPNSTH